MKILHDNKTQVITCLDERFYTTDGEVYYPSVTTILSEVYPKGYGYSQWLRDTGINADEVLKRAGEQGSHIHDAIDTLTKSGRVNWMNEDGSTNYTFDEWLMILKAYEFFEVFKPVVLANEVSLVSPAMGIGGTIDLVCEINGQTWLIDYKSSNAIYKTHELQVAAYAMMWNEANPDKQIHKTGVLHLKATTRGTGKPNTIQGNGWKIYTYDRTHQEAYDIFKHTKAIWDEEHPNYKPKNKEYPDFVELKITS